MLNMPLPGLHPVFSGRPPLSSAAIRFGADAKPAPRPTREQKIRTLTSKRHAAVVAQNDYLALMAKGDWLYATRPNATGVVAVMTLVHTADGPYLVFLKTRRPPMQGKTNTEPVAGLKGDHNAAESDAEAALRELDEEIGLKLDKAPVSLFDEAIASSPGMTDEKTRYFFAEATLDRAQVRAMKKHKARGDGSIIRGQVWVPFNDLLAKPQETLMAYSQKAGVPTKDMLSGLLLLLAHLRQTGRLRMEWTA